MGKRAAETTKEARIKNKIRRLEEKLQRKKRVRVISSSSEDEVIGQIVGDDRPDGESRRGSLSPSETQQAEFQCSNEQLDTTCAQEPIPGPSSALDLVDELTGAGGSNQMITTDNDSQEGALDEDILKILGDTPPEDTLLGKCIHKDIATRWQNILKNGLSKEVKQKIMEQYLIPSNCSFLLAPLLNPEAKAAIPDTLSKRDATILQKQNQIGIVLAALSKVMESILSNSASKQDLLQPLSDACRLLCDSHNAETKTRRSIILSSINVGLRDTLAETCRDKYLFGEDVSDKLKIAKSVQKTGESLQKITPKLAPKNFVLPRNKNHLNYKGQHRKTPNKWEAARGRGVAPPAPVRAPPPPPPSRPSAYPTSSRGRSPPPRRTYRR